MGLWFVFIELEICEKFESVGVLKMTTSRIRDSPLSRLPSLAYARGADEQDHSARKRDRHGDSLNERSRLARLRWYRGHQFLGLGVRVKVI